jgi:glycerol-3-phosphate acyltransferase PlsY
MAEFVTILQIIVLSYALGSIPFGVVLAKIFRLPDPRYIGSGNIGATNMLRSGRKDIAALTLLLDAVKAATAVLLARLLFDMGGILALLGAVVGHVYSPWLHFKGGKGVACALGGLLAVNFWAGLLTCAVWLITFLGTRLSSLSALVALLFAPFFVWWLMGTNEGGVMMLVSALVFYRHQQNIARLMRGEEPRFEFSKKDDEHV